jgi:CelD/BcsL family acetyltransferase involved in cellulose biosynthesis
VRAEIIVRETNPHLDVRWASFLKLHPSASVYHHPAWLAVLEREYQQEHVHLICENAAGELLGLFPLIYTRGLPFGKGWPLTGARLASFPRTPVAGPLTIDPCVNELFLAEAMRRASSRPGVRLQIKTQGADLSRLVDGVVAKPWRLTYSLHLPENSAEPFRVSNSQNRTSIKRAINKAVANGLRTRLAETEEDLATWYRCYLETMRRNFVPARPYRFFLALWELVRPRGLVRMLLADQQKAAESRIIGGSIFFNFHQTVTYAFGASRTSELALRPNDIILLQAISDAHRDGFLVVDLGEVPEGNEGLTRFKSKWGAKPVRLYRYYYPDFHDSKHSASDSETSPERAAKTMWQHLPLAVTPWLGDQVYANF